MKPQGIQVGVAVKYCNECERGDCKACASRIAFENLMSLPNCNDCEDKKFCAFVPNPGEHVRVNCPLHKPKKEDK